MNATTLSDKTLTAVEVRDRFSNEIKFTAQVDCSPDATFSVKLGLAVKWAVKHNSNLRFADLSSADLSSANLRFADLSSADLSSANLRFADLRFASVRGEKVARVLAIVERLNDPYRFIALELEAGGLKILAGCRWLTLAEFKAHVSDEYPGTDKGVETLAILAFIKARAKAAGVKS